MAEAASIPGDKAQREPGKAETHFRASWEARRQQAKYILPKEFWEYGREAHREFILGLKALLDATADRLDVDGGPPSKPKTTGRRKTKVDIDE